jgi:gliding motility-associated lipoprotein GldH
MRIKIKHAALLLLFLAVLASCGTNFVINESKSVTHPWKSTQTVDFEFEIQDTLASYSFFINIRNTIDYNYSNIYFFINTTFPNGQSSRDTVECIIANVRGKWLGKGMGNLKESSHLIREKLYFPSTGIYKMQIEQAMREDALTGIEDVGIKIIKEIN